jgi:hypothetical protein
MKPGRDVEDIEEERHSLYVSETPELVEDGDN